MIRKKPAPHLMRGGRRFSEKIMLEQKRPAKALAAAPSPSYKHREPVAIA
jgi:hypothetical protein